jgi:hypothetical protein
MTGGTVRKPRGRKSAARLYPFWGSLTEALPRHGALIVYDAMIDDARSRDAAVRHCPTDHRELERGRRR